MKTNLYHKTKIMKKFVDAVYTSCIIDCNNVLTYTFFL